MDTTDIVKKIQTAEGRLSSYYDKLDKDFKLWDLEEIKYEVHETAINVTTNEPRLFADDVQTDLASAEMQIVVRTLEEAREEEREKAGRIERLFNFLLSLADERLESLLLPPLKETLIWLFSIRGAAGARILNYIEDGKFIPDYMALDPRWLSYEVGGSGLSWIANKIFKTKTQLADEWGHEPKGAPWYKPWTKEKDLYQVYDYWEVTNGKVSNTVLCEKEAIHNEEYKKLTSLPFIFMPVTSRMPVVVAEGGSEQGRYGESIYASKRAMYELASKLTTTWATHARTLANQPLINEIDDVGLRLDRLTLYAEGVLNIPMGHQKISASPLKEISPTLINLVAWVEDKIERGQTPRLKMTSPPSSGTMANIYREAGNRIYNPQVRVLSHFYASMCRMIEAQLKAGGVGGDEIRKIKVETEKEGKYWSYDIKPVDLKKPHTIKVEFTVRTPWSQLDVTQQADMLRRLGLPDRWIWEFILKVPDPKLLEELAILEIAEKSPQIAMKKAVEVLMKYGRADDAEALIREMDRMEAQERMAAGEQAPPVGEGAASPNLRTEMPVPIGGSIGEPVPIKLPTEFPEEGGM